RRRRIGGEKFARIRGISGGFRGPRREDWKSGIGATISGRDYSLSLSLSLSLYLSVEFFVPPARVSEFRGRERRRRAVVGVSGFVWCACLF
uniref:Uncharacterized protein n=1 Tax=Oryza brachyantha TaxID=4533 RepID=J3LYB7_ORYBR